MIKASPMGNPLNMVSSVGYNSQQSYPKPHDIWMK